MSHPLGVDDASVGKYWIPPELIEQTGPSLLVSQQCWILKWSLTAQQQLQVKNSVENSFFQKLLEQVRISQKIKEVDARSVYDKYSEAMSSVDGSTDQYFSLDIIRCIALACKDILDLEEIAINTCSQLEGQAIAFCSSRHVVSGAFFVWIKELLWFLICKSESLNLPHLTSKQLQARSNNWQGMNNKINADWLLSSLLVSAKKRDIYAMPVDLSSGIWQVGMCSNGRLIRHSCKCFDSYWVLIAQNKRSTARLLKNIGCNVPREITISTNNLSPNYLHRIAAEMGFPCVVKPVNTDGGMCVTANIKNHTELKEAIELIRKAKKQQALLQEHVSGDDYRLFIMNYRLTCVTKQVVPHLVGDGVSTLQELLLAENKRREILRTNNCYASPLDEQDDLVNATLRRSGYGWNDVLGKDVRINLRSNANVKTGGLRIVVPLDDVHLSLKKKCEAIAHTFRLSVCGLDYISEDLQSDLSFAASSGSFIEVNAIPDCPPDRSEIILDGFESESALNLGVHVCVADFSGSFPSDFVERVSMLSRSTDNAVIAVSRSCLPALLNSLPSDVACDVQGYDHVHDPILNHTAELLIYCLSPEELARNGLPVKYVKTLDVFCSDQSLSIDGDLGRLKEFVAE